MQVDQILRFSLEVTQFLGIKKQPTNQNPEQAEISEYNCTDLPLQDSLFYGAKNKTAFALVVSFSHVHSLWPLQELRRGGNAEIVGTRLV